MHSRVELKLRLETKKVAPHVSHTCFTFTHASSHPTIAQLKRVAMHFINEITRGKGVRVCVLRLYECILNRRTWTLRVQRPICLRFLRVKSVGAHSLDMLQLYVLYVRSVQKTTAACTKAFLWQKSAAD